jgi:hypothetical protein
MRVVPLIIFPSELLTKYLLPVPKTLCSAGLGILVPPEDTTSIELEVNTSPGHFGQLIPLNQWAKEGNHCVD